MSATRETVLVGFVIVVVVVVVVRSFVCMSIRIYEQFQNMKELSFKFF